MSFLPGLGAVLRVRDFRRLFATRLISQCSDGVFQAGLAGYYFFSPEQQTSAPKALVAFAGVLLPYSLLGPFVGVFIDRWWRRQILVYEPLLRAVLVGAVAALLAVDNDGPLFFLAAIVGLGANRFFLAALSAALPHVVDRARLVTANSLSVTSGTIIAFIGGGVGYLLRRLFGAGHGGTALLMMCAAAAYLAAGLVATMLGRERLGPAPDTALPQTREALYNVLRGLIDGVRHIWSRRAPTVALGAITAHRLLYGIWTLMTLLLFSNYFAASADAGLSGAAAVLATSGVGYCLAALITPSIVRRIGMPPWITLLLALGGLSELVFVLPFNAVLYAVDGFVLGVVAQGVKISVDTIVQQTVLDAYRGRVFSGYDMLFNVAYVGGAAVGAVTLPTTGRSYVMVIVIAVGYGIAAAAYWVLARPVTGSGITEPGRRRPWRWRSGRPRRAYRRTAASRR